MWTSRDSSCRSVLHRRWGRREASILRCSVAALEPRKNPWSSLSGRQGLRPRHSPPYNTTFGGGKHSLSCPTFERTLMPWTPHRRGHGGGWALSERAVADASPCIGKQFCMFSLLCCRISGPGAFLLENELAMHSDGWEPFFAFAYCGWSCACLFQLFITF
jgi:hypothetical protein